MYSDYMLATRKCLNTGEQLAFKAGDEGRLQNESLNSDRVDRK